MKYRNIFWFLLDGLSPKYLYSCGNKNVNNNFIDKCLENGATFSQIYSANAGTHTSMHAFFSGFYSSVNGATGWTTEALRKFNPNIITLTDILKQNGYHTYRYCDAKGERTAPKSGFEVWESSGITIGNILNNTDYTRCENQQNFIKMVNDDKNNKFVYHHVELFHELNCALGYIWHSSDYVKNIEILAEHFEQLYKSYNISEDDLVIISSDHGVLLDVDYRQSEVLNGQRQEEISNICFLSISGKNIPKKLMSNLITAIDIPPTLAEIILDVNMVCQGSSLTDYIYHDNYTPKPCFREKGSYFVYPQSPNKSDTWCVRDNNWKYVFSEASKKSEWLINLDDGDYKINLKDKYPKLVQKYKKMIEDEIINNKLDIIELYKSNNYKYSKKNFKSEVSIIINGNRINSETFDSILDLAGPYFEVILTEKQAKNLDEKYLKHPRIKIVQKIEQSKLMSKYILNLKAGYNYEEELLSDLYKEIKAMPDNTIIRYARDKNIYMIATKIKNLKECKIVNFNKNIIKSNTLNKFFYKEKQGNKRILHICGLKISYKKFDKRKLKSDKTSEIEFYLIDSFEIYHFLPIYKELLNQGINARIVAEPCKINTSRTWFDYQNAIKILKELNIDYCTKCNPNAKIAITTQKANILSKYKHLKINFSYGFGFTNNYFINSKEAIEGFDIKFVHGNYPKQICEQYKCSTKIVSFGYPKYQDFLENPPVRKDLLKDLNINTNKKILTYFPTWDEDSSIQKFAKTLELLKENYFIITKPHHCTFRLSDKKEDLDTIYEISDLVLDGNYDFAKAALLGDIALCDIKSGASCEVAYLNRNIPIILLTPFDNLDRYNTVVTNIFNVINTPAKLQDELFNISKNGFDRTNLDDFLKEIYDDIPIAKTSKFLIELLQRR